jgi:cyanophycinase
MNPEHNMHEWQPTRRRWLGGLAALSVAPTGWTQVRRHGWLVIVGGDQHFSERRRTGRLLSVLAQRPQMLGVGIDEDTALVIERGQSVEIFGQGAVTLIDGRRMRSNVDDLEANERLEMLDVRLHVLPAGHRYDVTPKTRYLRESMPASLRDAIRVLVEPGPLRG